ncbi:tetratricopeptide repeat protein [Sediminitomix flava]|uniref:TPR repeat protein n=1 Tax=Sediminitomix flava TaxID=379075 RepID=A0A315ZX03_SEDFL|nr:tetratricopeptide repeat protein [Sediminitomix flava]PWJ41857.1 TPR repeat protein [Sediminitomix flava]
MKFYLYNFFILLLLSHLSSFAQNAPHIHLINDHEVMLNGEKVEISSLDGDEKLLVESHRRQLAFALLEEGIRTRSLAKLDSVNLLMPDLEIAYINKAVLKLEMNKFDEALALYDQALKLSPEHPKALYGKAICLEYLGENEKALANYKELMNQNIASEKVVQQVADIYYHKAEFDSALLYANQLIEDYPSNYKGYYLKAKIELEETTFEDAIFNLKRAQKLYVADNDSLRTDIHYYMALTHFLVDSFDVALSDIEQCLQIDSEHSDKFMNLKGKILFSLASYQDALEAFDEAIEKNQNSALFYNNRAVAHIRLQNYEQAIADVNKAIEIDNQLAEAYLNRGIALEASSEDAQACDDWQKALALGLSQADVYILDACQTDNKK